MSMRPPTSPEFGGCRLRLDKVVRVKHLPSGLEVWARSEQSAHEAQRRAMRVLRGRLYVRFERSEMPLVRTYSLVKGVVTDERGQLAHKNVEGVLDGNLDELILARLKRQRR